ncbi:hypothetical protein JX266_012200 [Neoarthrinium moseri]|nr:hypothetical protein JX266_012200 [Neoarthrinium moseri]
MATFHPFSRLPCELRAQIWSLTVEPRTVEVRVIHRNLLQLYDAPSTKTPSVPYLVSLRPVPATLQVCRGFRNQRLYQQAFSEVVDSDGAERRYVWLNRDIDMISIGTTPFSCFAPVASHIRRLEFESQNSIESFYRCEVRELHYFVNVKEIHVVCADGMAAWLGSAEDYYWPCGEENLFFIDPDDGQKLRSAEMEELFDAC